MNLEYEILIVQAVSLAVYDVEWSNLTLAAKHALLQSDDLRQILPSWQYERTCLVMEKCISQPTVASIIGALL